MDMRPGDRAAIEIVQHDGICQKCQGMAAVHALHILEKTKFSQ
jgi:hypothetical protein